MYAGPMIAIDGRDPKTGWADMSARILAIRAAKTQPTNKSAAPLDKPSKTR